MTVQAPDPEQAPPQLEKANPEFGLAVTVASTPGL
jgi:hypothetical protein